MPPARRTKYHNKAFSRKQPPLVLAEAIFQAVGFDNSTAGLFLLLTRLCFPETCCKITSVPETKASAHEPTRGETIPLVRAVLRYTKKSWMQFFCCTLHNDSSSRQAEISFHRLRFLLAVPGLSRPVEYCMHTVAVFF